MSKQLVLAEKPSVGREIGRVLGCTRREKGFNEGPDYVVTWALGHLIELAQPAEYSDQYKRWDMRSLPMLPTPLRQSIMKQTAEQYRIIEQLMHRDDINTVIIATDAGREGELVARWIMKMAGWDQRVLRLWISSQTDAAIIAGFTRLQDGSLYENLYAAAEARAAADWYVGMNVTRALTCRYDAKLSAGRVQTPTLALMTDREDEIETFSGGFYWTIRADFGVCTASWHDDAGSLRLLREEDAQAVVDLVRGKEGEITAVEETEKREQPPLAYDLTELQRDANIQLGFSAKETLDTLQRLYEHYKVVTYPRTDSRYITADIVPTMNSRLKALEATAFGQVASLFAEHGFREDMDRFVAESKVTDHHAIIPTEQRVDLSRFTKEERSLWELIALRFMEVLSEDYVYRTTRIEIKVANQQFMTRVSIPVKQGWRDMARLIGKRSAAVILDSDEGSSTTGTSFNVSDRLTVGAVRSRRTTTTPPERYTEASLLSAMEHAGRFVDDASLKKQLGGGLGTPATRADIIEKLIQNYYIERDGKYLKPTGKGRELIRLAPMQLRSPELTAKWEGRLSAIAEGEESAHQFIEDIKENAKQLVSQVASSKEQFRPRFSEGKTCPYCEAPMMKATDEFGQIHYICQRLSCSYEEALIKRRKQTAEKPTKAKRVVVQTKALPASSASGKKVVVVKRSTGTTPAVDQWETITEVIHPSRYRRETYTQKTAPKRNTKDSATDRRSSNPYAAPESSGTTFADLLAASEKRKKERDKKRKS